jgi:hypothetical protein
MTTVIYYDYEQKVQAQCRELIERQPGAPTAAAAIRQSSIRKG